MNSKKAQIHMTETVAVLFIFFVLILFGIIFYYQYQRVAIKEKNDELIAARAMDTTLKVLFLPELACSQGEAETEDNCADLMKVRHINAVFEQHTEDYFFNIFSYARISIQQVYPLNEEQEYVLYDKPKPGFTHKEPTFFVVSLRDESKSGTKTVYGLGYLVVEVYS